MYVVTVSLDNGYLNPNLNSIKLNGIDRNTSSPPRHKRQDSKIKKSKTKLKKNGFDGYEIRTRDDITSTGALSLKLTLKPVSLDLTRTTHQ